MISVRSTQLILFREFEAVSHDIIKTELVASSARSTASTAVPLPTQLVPLLDNSLQRVRDALSRVLPVSKPRKVLDEAEWEDEDGEDAGFAREMRLQGKNMSVSISEMVC